MATKRARRTPLLAGSGPLAGVSPAVAFVGVLAVFSAGVLVGGLTGAVLLGLLGLGVLALLAATWNVLSGPERALRLVALAALVAVVVAVLR
ncbi:MAG: hypothetical protein ACRDQ5_22280 [Sciscionella sp.]